MTERFRFSLLHPYCLRFCFLTLFAMVGFALISTANVQAEVARGVVFHDQNGNGTLDAGEPGLAGVRVSNGVDIVRTDAAGKYELTIDDDTIVFALKPSGWKTPVNEFNLPQFYYNHKPAGSPDKTFAHKGVRPTGPLPNSIDFALLPSEEPNEFSVLLMGDPQPYSREEVRYYANDLIAELVDSKAAFGISLGDIVGNKLSLFEYVNAVQAKVGVPWHNVHGNHDINFHSPNDKYADETFERIYGPTNYAFQYASVHFLLLDNVFWKGAVDNNKDGRPDEGNYFGKLRKDQIEFVTNYVAEVPVDECIVICTHIPLVNPNGERFGTPQLKKLLKILVKHPHQLSFSAHTHYTRQDFVGGTEHRHTEHTPHEGEGHEHHNFQLHHHHNTATASGSWFRGPKDEQGIPMTPMRDGTPNGYLTATFTGSNYKLRYKAARMPAKYQMAIFAPEVTLVSEATNTEVVANVFNGNVKTTVKMRIRGVGDWITMERNEREDPTYREMFKRDDADKDRPHTLLPPPIKTPHIWVAKLPAGLTPGVHVLEVESTDMFKQVDRGIRLIEVDPDPATAVEKETPTTEVTTKSATEVK